MTDLFDSSIVAHTVATSPTTALTAESLAQAIKTCASEPGWMIHTDQPSPFTLDFTACYGRLDAREHPASVSTEVPITIRGNKLQPVLFRSVDPLFDLRRLSCSKIQVLADNCDVWELFGHGVQEVFGRDV